MIPRGNLANHCAMSHRALTISAIAALECLATMKIISRASATGREREEVKHLLGSTCWEKSPWFFPRGGNMRVVGAALPWAQPERPWNPGTLHERLALPGLCGAGWWGPGGQTAGSFIAPSQPNWELLLSLGVW